MIKVDSQSVQTIYNYENVITDTLRNLLPVKGKPENWQDTTIGDIVFEECLHQYPSLMGLSADFDYRGTTVNQATDIQRSHFVVHIAHEMGWVNVLLLGLIIAKDYQRTTK